MFREVRFEPKYFGEHLVLSGSCRYFCQALNFQEKRSLGLVQKRFASSLNFGLRLRTTHQNLQINHGLL